jgi:tRNA(adenine34) deaminase
LRESGDRAQTARMGAPIGDAQAMALALHEARRCLAWEDVPVGAVVVRDGVVIAAAGNERERLGDPTAHAEILALRAAAGRLGTWRLEGCTIYVTLEPCAMCAGAMVLSRMRRLVFGAVDPKGGFAGSLGDLVRHDGLNHRLEVAGGVLANESADLLQSFFRERRPNAGAGALGSANRGPAIPPPR